MAANNKAKKIITILKNFYSKIDKIEADKQKLLADIQTTQDQDKIKQAQEKLKNL